MLLVLYIEDLESNPIYGILNPRNCFGCPMLIYFNTWLIHMH